MGKNILTTYTVNVAGNQLAEVIEQSTYHAYYANDVTAIEIPAYSKRQTWDIAMNMGFQVYYVFV